MFKWICIAIFLPYVAFHIKKMFALLHLYLTVVFKIVIQESIQGKVCCQRFQICRSYKTLFDHTKFSYMLDVPET